MDSKDNPGYSSLLIKRGIHGLENDYYQLWKLLQEILGREWFQRVFLERKNLKKYGIDYNAIDEIVGELNRIIIESKPNLIGFLAGPNAHFVNCVVETFSRQKKEAENELERRAAFDKDINFILPEEKDILKKRRITLMNMTSGNNNKNDNDNRNNYDSKEEVTGIDGSSNSGFELEGLNEQDMIQSKVSITNPSSLNTQARTLKEQLMAPIDLNYEKVILDSLTAEEIKKQNMKLKKREHMLLNEIVNLQKERYVATKRNYVLEKRYDQVVDFVKDAMKKMKIEWEGETFAKQLLKLKEVDGDSLRRAGVDRAIKKGRTDLLAKLIIHATSHNSKVDKSTNTESDQYTDLSKDSDLVLWVTAKLKRLKKKEESFFNRSRDKSRSKTGGKSSHFSMRSGLTSMRNKKNKKKKDKSNNMSGISEVTKNRSVEARKVLDKSYDSKVDEISEIITNENKSMIDGGTKDNLSLGQKSVTKIKIGGGNLGKKISNSGDIKPSNNFEKTPSFNNPYSGDKTSENHIKEKSEESSLNQQSEEDQSKTKKNSTKKSNITTNNNINKTGSIEDHLTPYKNRTEQTLSILNKNSLISETVKTEEEFTLTNKKEEIEAVKKNFDKYMEKFESKHKNKKVGKYDIQKMIRKALAKYHQTQSLKKSRLYMNLLNTVEITGKIPGEIGFIQMANIIPTGEIPLENEDEDDKNYDNPLLQALRNNNSSQISLAITGRTDESELRRNIEKAKREMMIRKLRELQIQDKKRFKQDEINQYNKLKNSKLSALDKEKLKELEKKRAEEIEKKLKNAFKENSREDIINLKKNVNLNSSDLYKSDRELSVELESGEIIASEIKENNIQIVEKSNKQTNTVRNPKTFKVLKNANFGTGDEDEDPNFLPRINSRNNLDNMNNQYSPRYREEKYKHFSPQRQLSKKLRKLENNYNQANMTSNEGNVHERLHNEHIVREIILNEKKVLIEKYEETKWTMNLLDQGVILYDINGVTLVYDTDSSKTYLDIRRAVKNFKDSENKFDYQSLNRDPRPTYITELNDKILRDVKKEFYEVTSHEVNSKNSNNYIPVEQMMDGELGITLNSLSLVIHKIFNQIYGLKERMDKKTQTNATSVILSHIERRKKVDYLIRGVRGVNKKKKKNEERKSNAEFEREGVSRSFVGEAVGRQFMTQVEEVGRGRSLEIQNTY